MLNIKEELAKLKGIHEPQDIISMFPLAPIWKILIILFCIALLFFILIFIYKKKKYLKLSALKKINQISNDLDNNKTSDLKAINKISVLIRKLAVIKFEQENIASITGKEWLAFLDKNLNEQCFQSETGKLLITANYQKKLPEGAQVKNLISICKTWINKNL